MTTADDAVRFCADLLAGLADVGVRTAFISPGSRNTPLTLAATAEPRIRDLNVRDERSAGFMAVGHGKRTGSAAIVVCTSGSAAAHYLPAIVEANQSATPLIVLTSDRPLHLRGTGAPQTMDQVGLYGRHVKLAMDLVDRDDPHQIGVELAVAAMGGIKGPVHANVPFDEPLVPTISHHPPAARSIEPLPPPPHDPTRILDELADRRSLLVVSGTQRPGFATAIAAAASRLGAPILADPQTRVEGDHVIERGDLLVAAHDRDGAPIVLERFTPDVVVRFGPLPTSKPLWRWMETSGIRQFHVDASRLADPLGSATAIHADPTAFLESEPIPVGRSWIGRWKALDAAADRALVTSMASLRFPNEPEIAMITSDHAPVGTLLWVASSRPIRDVDAFARRRSDRMVLANRGVNGIDGTISSAIGAALDDTPTMLLIGDVAFLHDATAVAEAAAFGVPLRIVVVNNDGGGIFSFLPHATAAAIPHDIYERHWGTPHGISAVAVAHALGMRGRRINERDAFVTAVEAPVTEPELIEITTNRSDLILDHETIRDAVAAAVEDVVATSGGGEDVQEGS